MAISYGKIVDVTQLESDLTAIADKIRQKSNIDTELLFPDDFINTIDTLGETNFLPEFTYTGTYQIIDDGAGDNGRNWRIKFLSSGTLTITKISGEIDLFLVGGGGGRSTKTSAGGGGGYTSTVKKVPFALNTAYSIVIGGGGGDAEYVGGTGGTSSAFGNSATGGQGSYRTEYNGNKYSDGGKGGSGGGAGSGAGGSNGGNGGYGGSYVAYNGAAKGQGSTTGEFGDSTATLYSHGGNGSVYTGTNSASGALANSGNGGSASKTTGQSGIVIIRNAR